METSRKRTYESLDLWRGLAAIWVVLFHSITSILSDTTQTLHGNIFAEFCIRGDAGVNMFFVVSGYCISASAVSLIEKKQDIGRFVKARVRRVFPPYWISLFVFIVMSLMAWMAQSEGIITDSSSADLFHKLTPWSILTNIFLVQVPLKEDSINVVSWTLNYELAFYAVVAVAIFLFRKRGEQFLLNALHVVTVVSLLVVTFAPDRASFPFNSWICFGEGVLLFDILCGLPWNVRTKTGRLFYIGVVLAIALLLVIQLQDTNHFTGTWRVMIGTIFAIVLWQLYPVDGRIKEIKLLKGLFVVGTISYSLYLFHFAIIGFMRQLARKSHVPFHLFAFEAFLELGVSIAVAYVLYRTVETRFMSRKPRVVSGV